MFIQPRKNIFQQIKQLQEADNDANDIMNIDIDQNTTNTDPNADPNAGEAESTSDDDLSVDTNLEGLDDPMTTSDDNGGEMNDDFGGGDTSSTTDSSSTDKNEEVKKGNTDLFSSLTAEEQSIKIMELKKLYNDLYTSTDDLVYKLSNLSLANVDPRILVRIQSQMEELRRMMQDYIISSFPIKTYYENDVNYSIFLSMFTTIRGVFDEVYKQIHQNSSNK